MQALGGLNPLYTLEAELQAKIGNFLSAKKELIDLRDTSSLTISSKASGLLVKQYSLENNLTDVLKSVELAKQGMYTFANINEIATFIYDIDKHEKNIKKLKKEKKDIADNGILKPSIFKPFTLKPSFIVPAILGTIWLTKK